MGNFAGTAKKRFKSNDQSIQKRTHSTSLFNEVFVIGIMLMIIFKKVIFLSVFFIFSIIHGIYP
jgi:hypothetical protein